MVDSIEEANAAIDAASATGSRPSGVSRSSLERIPSRRMPRPSSQIHPATPSSPVSNSVRATGRQDDGVVARALADAVVSSP